ncbi:13621_t:CDS:2, partial [Cetraspora pellucida]
NASIVSNESVETITASGSQSQEERSPEIGIDTQTKTYVDTVIQTTATAIMRTMQQYMDQQFEAQREWNSQCMDTINQRFTQLEQTSQQSNNNNHQNDDTNQTITNNQQGNMETDRDTGTSQATEQQ